MLLGNVKDTEREGGARCLQLTSMQIRDCTRQVSGAALCRWMEMQVTFRNAAAGVIQTDTLTSITNGPRLACEDLCLRQERLKGSGASETRLHGNASRLQLLNNNDCVCSLLMFDSLYRGPQGLYVVQAWT